MAGSVNKVILLGNLGQDPDIRTMQNGKKVCTFSIATSDSWKDKETGEKKEKTEWHRVVVFNEGLIGVVENYIKKGTKLYIEGALQTRKWTDDKGIEKYTTEIVIQGYGGRIDIVSAKGNNQELSQDQDVSENADVSSKETVSKKNIKKNTDDKSDTSIDEEDIPF
jgi:single-strand DNA-binding protein